MYIREMACKWNLFLRKYNSEYSNNKTKLFNYNANVIFQNHNLLLTEFDKFFFRLTCCCICSELLLDTQHRRRKATHSFGSHTEEDNNNNTKMDLKGIGFRYMNLCETGDKPDEWLQF